mgnify:CR=1 FL=1
MNKSMYLLLIIFFLCVPSLLIAGEKIEREDTLSPGNKSMKTLTKIEGTFTTEPQTGQEELPILGSHITKTKVVSSEGVSIRTTIFYPDLIKIKSARYGGIGPFGNPGWFTDESLLDVYKACNNKQECFIGINNKTMGGDPCRGSKKNLEIFYQCLRYDDESKNYRITSSVMNHSFPENSVANISCGRNPVKTFD